MFWARDTHLIRQLLRATNTPAYVSFAIVLVLSATLVQSTFAVSYIPGLKTGDIGNYSLFGNYAHGTVNGQLKVLGVTGTNVTINFTDYPPGGFANGGGKMWIDIYSGQTNNQSSGIYFAVAPNLKMGDPVFNGASVTITAVQSQACGGAYRQLIKTAYVINPRNVINANWDQNTGILCNFGLNDQQGGILGFTLDNTTLWSGASLPQDVFVTAFEISTFLGAPLVILIVFVYFRRRRRLRLGRR